MNLYYPIRSVNTKFRLYIYFMTLKNHADVHCYCALEYPLKKHFSHAFQNQCCKTFLKNPSNMAKIQFCEGT